MDVIDELIAYCEAWEPWARVMGNVCAGDAAKALRGLRADLTMAGRSTRRLSPNVTLHGKKSNTCAPSLPTFPKPRTAYYMYLIPDLIAQAFRERQMNYGAPSLGNSYRCAHCKKVVKRNSDKQWIPSLCMDTGKTVHLQRVKK